MSKRSINNIRRNIKRGYVSTDEIAGQDDIVSTFLEMDSDGSIDEGTEAYGLECEERTYEY